MDYKLKVSFRSNGRTYAPGEILPKGISAGDLIFLKRKGFVWPADVAIPAEDIPDQVSGPDMDEEEGICFPDFDGLAQETVKSPEEIQKMRTKDEVYSYAQSVGLNLGDDYKEKGLKELQERVIDFQAQAEGPVMS